jgi:Mg2+ and Co2+ transporter CorA
MIPREEILKQINRFYDMVESIDNQIEQRKETISDETNKDEMDINFNLLRTYFKLTSKVGPKMMDAIDNLKNELDIKDCK